MGRARPGNSRPLRREKIAGPLGGAPGQGLFGDLVSAVVAAALVVLSGAPMAVIKQGYWS